MRFIHRLKMLLRGRYKSVVAISIFLLSSSFFVTSAFALAAVTTSDVLILNDGQGILPNSPPTALLRIQVDFSGTLPTTLGIEAAVIDAGGLNPDGSDISQLSIYRDNGDGIFSSADSEIAVTVISNPVPGTAYNLVFPETVVAGTNWYFIVIKTSGSISHGDIFQGRLVSFNAVPGGSSGGPWSDSRTVTCECKVVDVYYTESDTNLFQTWDLVSGDTEASYWKPNYLPNYKIDQEMTEPNETNLLGAPHIYSLSEARRYSYFIEGTENDTDRKAALSNSLKFERRRKLMGMNVKTPVLGIKVAGKNQFQDATYSDTDYFGTMVITFTDTLRPDTENFDPQTMLRPMYSLFPLDSGVAVYQDTNKNDRFDEGVDQVLNVDSFSWGLWSGDEKTLTLNFSAPADNSHAAVPWLFDADLDDRTGHDTTGVDFFVVLRGDPNEMDYGADFTVRVSDMAFQDYNGDPGADPPASYATWYETKEIKAVFELSDYTGTRVDPGTTFPIIGINVNTGDAGVSETLGGFTFYLKGPVDDFAPGTDLTGVSVLDRSTGDTVPVTLSSWSPVTYRDEGWWATTVAFNSTETIPDDDIGTDFGPDYFVNLTTSSGFGYNKKIVAAIPDNGFTFGSGKTSAKGTALITNANVDHGSNQRVYPDIDPSAPIHNPILGNPSVVFNQTTASIAAESGPTKIISIDLADNSTVDTVVLKSVVVQIGPTIGGFAPSDLMLMTDNSLTSGIGLYDAAGPLDLAFPPSLDFTLPFIENYRRYLLVLRDPLPIPTSPGGDPELFVTLNTSGTISFGDAMIARIWGSEITPCSSYGLGFRAKDDSVTDTEAISYEATIVGPDTLTLASALGGLDADYNNNWYLVITGGVPEDKLGQIYKVTEVDGSITPLTPDVTVGDADLTTFVGTVGTTVEVKFFKVESTSYQNNFSAPVVCSGIYNLNIIEPSSVSPSETPDPITRLYTIQYDADAPVGTALKLYRVPSFRDYVVGDSSIVDTVLYSSGPGTYIWDTRTVPTGTYRIYGKLGPDGLGNTATDYSPGTVTITNTAPTNGSLTITPTTITIGTTASIVLHDIVDKDTNTLSVRFYSTNTTTPAPPSDEWNAPGTFPFSADSYPTDLTVSWGTAGRPAGIRYLWALISDGVNPAVLVGPVQFTLVTFGAPTGSATNQVISGQGILPNSPLTALLGLNLTRGASSDPLTSVQVIFTSVDGFGASDLAEVALYYDSNRSGSFDFGGDSFLGSVLSPGSLSVTIPISSVGLPPNDSAPYAGIDYFIVVRTSNTINHADAFYATVYGINGNNITGVYGVSSGTVRCECKVVDIYYTESEPGLDGMNLVANAYETYWQPNYLFNHSIAQEMTEPDEDLWASTHPYYLSEAWRYSYLDGTENNMNVTAAYSNFLKFERRRKLMGMNVLTPVLGIKVAGKNQRQSYNSGYYDNDYLQQIDIIFRDTSTSNFDPQTMLFNIMPNFPTLSGVAVYQDTNNSGVFDEGDTALEISSASGWSISGPDEKTLTLDFISYPYNPQTVIPQVFDADLYNYDWQDRHDTTGSDFFVVLRARPEPQDLTKKIDYGADFTVRVGNMEFVGANPLPPKPLWYETREIKAVFELSDYTGTRVDPNSTFPIIGINVNDGGLSETLNYFNLYLKKDGTNFDPTADLASSDAGITVLNRSGSAVGVDFSGGWSIETDYQGSGEDWWKTTVNFSPAVAIPNDDIGENAGPDYVIFLTTNSNFGYGKQIIASIPDNEFIFGTNLPSANGTALTTNANVDHGSNQRVYPDIYPSAPIHNPILGNPSVVFNQTTASIAAESGPTKIISIDLADNSTVDTVVLKSVVVQIVDTTSGGFTPSDLLAMDTDSAKSGIGLYDADDVPIELAFPPSPDFSNTAENYRRYLLVLKDPLPIPTSPGGDPELFVTLNTSSTISSTDAVILRIWGSEIKPCSSYGLGFRAAEDTTGADTAVETNQGTYFAYGVISYTQNTLRLSSPLGGSSGDYAENWYLAITAGGNNAIGRIYKVTSVATPAGTPVVTVEGMDLTKIGLGSTGAVKFFKVESTSYHNTNNYFLVNSTGGGGSVENEVILEGVSNATAIVLTWIDGTHGNPATGFVIQRRNLGVTTWTTIKTLNSSDPELKVIGPWTYRYTDADGLLLNSTYEYQVTVSDGGAVSNIISVFFSAFKYTPKNLDTVSGIRNVTLAWDWPSWYTAFEDGFSIERKGKSEADFTVRDILYANISLGTTNFGNKLDNFRTYLDEDFTDEALAIEKTYAYRVRAFKGTGAVRVYSDYSNVDTILEVFSSDIIPGGSGTGGSGGGGAVGPLAVGISALLGWWKRRKQRQG